METVKSIMGTGGRLDTEKRQDFWNDSKYGADWVLDEKNDNCIAVFVHFYILGFYIYCSMDSLLKNIWNNPTSSLINYRIIYSFCFPRLFMMLPVY